MSTNKPSNQPPTGANENQGVDPDPVSIAMLAVGGVALVLQFASTWRQYNPTPHALRHRGPERSSIEHLEGAIADLQRDFTKITRAIDHGSKNPEAELYNAPMRVGATSLILDQDDHASYTSSLAEAYGHMSQVARWTNSMIGNQPALASEIGKELDEPLSQVAERMNAAMSDGRPIGEVISEFRHVLEVVARVLNAKLSDRRN